jgi:hypothetical protein
MDELVPSSSELVTVRYKNTEAEIDVDYCGAQS